MLLQNAQETTSFVGESERSIADVFESMLLELLRFVVHRHLPNKCQENEKGSNSLTHRTAKSYVLKSHVEETHLAHIETQ